VKEYSNHGFGAKEGIILDEVQQQGQEQWDVKKGKMQTKYWLRQKSFLAVRIGGNLHAWDLL